MQRVILTSIAFALGFALVVFIGLHERPQPTSGLAGGEIKISDINKKLGKDGSADFRQPSVLTMGRCLDATAANDPDCFRPREILAESLTMRVVKHVAEETIKDGAQSILEKIAARHPSRAVRGTVLALGFVVIEWTIHGLSGPPPPNHDLRNACEAHPELPSCIELQRLADEQAGKHWRDR